MRDCPDKLDRARDRSAAGLLSDLGASIQMSGVGEETAGRPQTPVATGEDKGILQVDATTRFARHLDVEQPRSKDRKERIRDEYTLWRRRAPPIPSFTGLVEPAEQGKIGIACSGGGIRSAAFSLGALQKLQEQGKLQQARYLAGVSGGSYIAAAFSMVRKTCPMQPKPGADGKIPPCHDSDPRKLDAQNPPFFRGSPEEQYLRNRSSYLAPGAFGKIQFGYRLLLGMILNLLFIAFAMITVAVPLALIYGGIYPSLAAHVGTKGLCHTPEPGQAYSALCNFDPLRIPPWLWGPLAGLALLAGAVGAASILAYRWRGRVAEAIQMWTLRALLVVGALGFLLIGLPVLLSLIRALGAATGVHLSMPSSGGATTAHAHTEGASEVSPATAVAAGAGGVATLSGAVLLQLRAEWGEAKVVAGEVGKAREWYEKLTPRLRLLLAYLIAAVVGPALTVLIALGAMTIALNLPLIWEPWALAALLAIAFSIAYYFADLTTWSLHSFYRRRLCSAFALKRIARPRGYPPIATEDAGMAVERDYHRLVKLSQTAVVSDDLCGSWPTLLVCAAANISDSAATPPGRAVTSFTFSATAMGGPLVGAVPTKLLEDSCDETRRSYFTLPAAVAMSGAALSPSMGKMTRWPLRFLMGLANIRLGVWVPNPRRQQLFCESSKTNDDDNDEDGNKAEATAPDNNGKGKGRYPRPRASYLLRELLGINSINAPYLYVTDGGHYENLGLVELLRRGCTEIYVFDASNDDFGAAGDAVSLARSELNVEVALDYSELQPNEQSQISATDCVTATIEFPDQPQLSAKLYYARLTMTSDSPADAVAYQTRDPRFPHDPTSDQLYTDQRFEAYRSLGAQAASTALKRREEAAPQA
jgi:hypothetical protein